MRTYVIRLGVGRFAAQMNAATKLPDLVWHNPERCWTTTDDEAAKTMRRLGAVVTVADR